MPALVLGALFARGLVSCTPDLTPVIPPMGYDQQVCLSIASPIDGNCFELSNPATQTIPVTLELNSTFALRPPGSCSTNALNNCGHAIFYVNGQCATRSAGLLTDISLADMHDPYGKVTITALLVDDCDTPWTLLWDDAGVIEDGGIMCLPQDGGVDRGTMAMNNCPAGLPPAPSSKVKNTCPEDENPDANVNQGPYFASVTINVQPTCPGGNAASTSSTSTSVTSSTGAGTGGASASSSASGMGGASSSASGTGGASASSSASGTGGASASSSASGTGGASSSSASGTGGASSSSASGTGGASTSATTSTSTSTSSASGMGGASSSASGAGGASSSSTSGAGGGAADAGDGG